jgi:DNA mismatch endonuclease (patch repair protein)
MKQLSFACEHILERDFLKPTITGSCEKDRDIRQRTMRAIRKVNTKPEIRVRSLLHRAGLRFRLHARQLPGTPDIVLRKHNTAILVNGCFWHQHPKCRYAKLPRARPEYWLPKLARNVERDVKNQEALAKLGWRVLVVWECETEDLPKLSRRLLQDLLGTNKVR